ncbi:conserved hypothetical protein [Halorhabdus tiamatea SARL4B]|uniref:Uncharacterized protein n=1 Tax=Halorhabdus tiamatea SARL4B TaxID=1033806 RepID=F7PKV4_9EURY|nr:conserved hypothetical protein [Halorhabdus tiamatea SARL4B]
MNEPTYRYERLEVVTNGSSIEYADQPVTQLRVPISDAIACSGRWTRVCGLERFVLENRPIPTETYTSRADYDGSVGPANPYQYALRNQSLYEPTSVVNESSRNADGMYRIEMDLEPVSPETVLRRVSTPATAEDAVPSLVAQTARTGTVTAHRSVEVPHTPIQLENGSYYRVYLAETTDDIPPISQLVHFLLVYIAPLFGIYFLVRIRQRVEITYIGSNSR